MFIFRGDRQWQEKETPHHHHRQTPSELGAKVFARNFGKLCVVGGFLWG